MPTKAEIKRLSKPIKVKIRKGDKVRIIAGKDKGQEGFVAAVSAKEGKVIILKDNPENPEQPLPLNVVVKHRKARMQGERSARIMIPAPIHISNVMVLDPKTGEPTRLGKKVVDGKKVRFSKKSGEVIVDAPITSDNK